MLHCTTTFYPRGGGSWSGRTTPTIPSIETPGDLISAATIAQGGGK